MMTPLIRRTFATALAGAALVGCSAPAQPPGPSGTDWFDGVRRQLMSTDADRGAVTIVSVDAARTDEVVVGIDPARIAAVDASTVLVTLRGQRELVVLVRGSEGWAVDRRIATGAEPLGLAVDVEQAQVYVAASHANTVEVYDLASGARIREIGVPGHPRSVALHASGDWLYVGTEQRGLAAVELSSGELHPVVMPAVGGPPMSARITGDVVLSPDHTRLSVPMAFVDISTPLGDRQSFDGNGYATTIVGPRLVPAVVDVSLDGDGAPGEPISSTPVVSDTRLPYISNIAYDAQGDNLWVTFDGHDDVLGLAGRPEWRAGRSGTMVRQVRSQMLGVRPTISPDGEVFLTSHLTRAVASVDPQKTLRVTALLERAPSPLPADVQQGRLRFFTALPGDMTAGVLSCATCHFEGRADGTTWLFERGPRQTPSLAERVRERAPLRWGGDRSSIAEDTLLTAAAMGGRGLSSTDAEAVEAYVESIRGVDLPLHGADDPLARDGAALFEQAGCASCHAGELRTDRSAHALAGRIPVQTPSLLGVAATAPYMFDGTVGSLMMVVERADELGHGRTAWLEPVQRAALVRYLESL